MSIKEGACTCDCALCAQGEHCEDPDAGCFVKTGPEIIDLPEGVSPEEAERLGICTCECALCAQGEHCENPYDRCFVKTGPEISDLPENVTPEEAEKLNAEAGDLDW